MASELKIVSFSINYFSEIQNSALSNSYNEQLSVWLNPMLAFSLRKSVKKD